MSKRPMPIAHRLLRSIQENDRGCWEYLGCINGQVFVAQGAWPENKRCINPEHLSLGTEADNHSDAIAKRRHAFGVRTGTAKLNDEAIAAIRKEGGTHTSVAEIYGVHRSMIANIRARKNWRHVP